MQTDPHLLYRAIASAQTGITMAVVRGTQQHLIFVNPAFLRLTGYTEADVMGKNCRLLQVSDTDQPGLTTLRTALSAGTETTVLLKNYRKNGEMFWNELTVSPIHDSNGELTHFFGFQNDVTQRETAAAALRELNVALARRTRDLQTANEALDAFSHSVSHDLRGPLASIDGFCTILGRELETADAKRIRHCLDRIAFNAKKMDALITAVLGLATTGAAPLQAQRCDLSAMAAELLTSLRERDPERGVNTNIDAGIVALGDPALLRIVLDNLLGNAWKFTSRTPHAAIRFGVDNAQPESPVFYVSDNGAGFDPASAGALFGAFARLHSAAEFPGTGIGLATVRRIVTRHGGRVWASSAAGRGATFFFTTGPAPAARDKAGQSPG